MKTFGKRPSSRHVSKSIGTGSLYVCKNNTFVPCYLVDNILYPLFAINETSWQRFHIIKIVFFFLMFVSTAATFSHTFRSPKLPSYSKYHGMKAENLLSFTYLLISNTNVLACYFSTFSGHCMSTVLLW